MRLSLYNFFAQLLLLQLLLTSCLNKVSVKVPQNTAHTAPSLTWNYSNLTILPGEEIPFQITDGTAPYTTNANGIGTFDSTTLIYTAPVNRTAINHTIGLSDSAGKTGTNTFKISAFQPSSEITFPPSFGDQNYVTAAATTANGNIFISSVTIDSPGWERWVLFKSSDVGATWSEVDQYVPYEEGESHPMAMIAKNNDLYTCGYIWESSGVYQSEWVVRKSTNGGSSWSNVDVYHDNIGRNHVCYNIALDPVSGHIFTSGYDYTVTGTERGLIRESADDGATWTTIQTVNGVIFFSVKVSPDGTLWAMADNGTLYKGTYSLGVWNWSSAGTLISGSDSSGLYELRGNLTIIDDNTAYYTYSSSNAWKINKTVNGGASWTSSYSGAAGSRGRELLQLSNGDLLAVGKSAAPYSFEVLKSTDNGVSWTSSYSSNNTPEKEGHVLLEANDGSIIAFGNYSNDPSQIVSVRSTDNGTSWAARPDIYFKQNLYTSMSFIAASSDGTLWAAAWDYFIDANFKSPWVLLKSTDKGATWSQSDVFTDAVDHQTAEGISFGPSGEIYVSGTKGTTGILRKSSDNGASWSQVDSHTVVGAVYSYNTKTAALPNGDVFYGGITSVAGGNKIDLRRGTTNGTVWSTVNTFPQAGSTKFTINDMRAFSDGKLWVYGTDTKGGSNYGVLYLSTDNGVTFTEKYRALNDTVLNLMRASNGDYYIIRNNKLAKSSDGGTTWTDVFVGGGALGTISTYTLDSNDKIFIVNTDDKIITQNQFSNAFYVTFDYYALYSYNSQAIVDIIRCGNSGEVCAVGHYEHSIIGSYHTLIPLVVP